ncbi:MAG: DotU family type IV/VI secretion system protein [Candidatus Symbiodolus clandestinus]
MSREVKMQLLQLYQPFMSTVLLIREGIRPLPPEGVYQALMQLWTESEAAVAKLGWPKALTTDAAFAVCVWADEQLLLSPQAKAIAWRPLQSQLYQTQCGGEEFFSRLDALFSHYALIDEKHHSRRVMDEVLAVFGVCLSCHFKGSYYHSGTPAIQQLRQRINQQLALTSVGFEIFPADDATQWLTTRHWQRFDPFSLLLIAAVLLGTLIVLLVYQELLATEQLSFPV